jgi:teichuronic acid biosynthesis glycosyltransferase TuaC
VITIVSKNKLLVVKVLFVRSGNLGIDPITQNQAESLIESGVDVVFFDIIGKGFLGYLLNIPHLSRKIKEEKPDLIHSHYSLSGFSTALTFCKEPIVVSLMGSDVFKSSLAQKILIKLFCSIFFNSIIVKSNGMRDELGLEGVFVLPNGVNLSRYWEIKKEDSIKKLGWDKSQIHILFASNPDRLEKNFKLAKEALGMIESMNFNIHFLMNIKQKEMPYYYSAADCLLLTSKHEGSPNVIKEAMACNCPIVATDVGDIKEIVGNTEGCFVTGFDANEIAIRINQVIESGKRTNGRTKIAYLDSKIIASRLKAIYESVINNQTK